MGDYPRSQGGYAFEIDEPAAKRVLGELPECLGITFEVNSVCRKDSTELDAADRKRICESVRNACTRRIVVTHGTDTLIESARYVVSDGAAADKVVVFTGAMKPERFKDSDASFNL